MISESSRLSAWVLFTGKQESWKLFNSFTHSGYRHLRKRYTENAIEANYPDQELIAALDLLAPPQS